MITGVGVVSAIGNDTDSFWASLVEGRSGIGPITRVDVSNLRFKNAAEVRDFDPEQHFSEKELQWLDPFAQYGIVAARQAIADSGVALTPELCSMTGVVTGSCLGGKPTEDAEFYQLYGLGHMRRPPTTIPRVMANSAASNISMEFGFQGPTFTTSTACSSGNHAIGQAYWLVRQGTLDMAVTGGSEAPICFGHLKAWEMMRVVAQDTCRPFSKDRGGMILGEGGAMFVIETLDAALDRGAHIYAELCGFGMSADAHHLTMPLVGGAARAIRDALNDGGIAADEIGYINAHGTGTPANDPMETKAIREVFGQHADRLAVSSTKSMHGHTLGAAGAIEAAATVLALDRQILPPTANYNEPDPECDLDVVSNASRPAEINAALSNSFAFGGLNAVLAFKRWDPDSE